jgi:DNA invertase Pin-like site-specific DNA recombinase
MSKENLAIALCRVSSIEQLKNNSLATQQGNVFEAAKKLNVTIPRDGIWAGQVSSKKGVNYGRKDLLQMFEYCKKNKRVKYLIVQEVDRFMRSPDEQTYWWVRFWYEVQVRIWFADKPELNEDTHVASLLRYVEGWRAGGSNEERISKSINGQTAALKAGRYPFSPKPGYMKGRRAGVPEIHPVRGPALRNVLIRIAEHIVTPTQGLIELNKSDYTLERATLKMDKFRNIATDPFNAGVVEIDQQVKVRNEAGVHEPLINPDQHRELIRIFDTKKKNQLGPRKNGNPEYPLNTITLHDTCLELKNKGKFVGYKHSNGKNPSLIYKKYRCRSCGLYLSRDDLHSKVAQLFTDNPISEDGIRNLSEALDTVWNQKNSEAKQESSRISKQINSLRQDIENRAMAAIDPSNIAIKPEILSNIEKMKSQITELEEQLTILNEKSDTDKQRFLDFAFNFAINMQESFFSLTPEDAKKCKQIIFPAGFYMDSDKNVYTPEISPLIRLATNKKDAEASDFTHLVRVPGL